MVSESASQPAPMRIGGRTFWWGARTYVMGIVNATPDSFSGDGVLDAAHAAAQARRMVADGADLIDVGAESTRPSAAPVDGDTEWARLATILVAVRAAVCVPITVDTSKAVVAAQAFAAGADALNDVQGLRADPALAPLLARSGRPAVLMHNQRGRPSSGDVVGDIGVGLRASMALAEGAGVDPAQLMCDPGFGFGWAPAQNLALLGGIRLLRALGRPLLVGTSRKSTIGIVTGRGEQERIWGTAATVALAVRAGTDMVRVHDVHEMYDVVRTADAAVRGWPPCERRVWLALGGNVGDRIAQLRTALDAIDAGGVTIDLVSAVYETPPWGITEQPRFANAVIAAHSTLSASALLALAKRIEAAAGRDPAAPRNSARAIDVDIVAIESEVLHTPDLEVPHAAMHERAFVLVPMVDVAPDWRHPRLRRTARALLADVDVSGITLLAPPGWWAGRGGAHG